MHLVIIVELWKDYKMKQEAVYGESPRIVHMRAREAAQYVGCGLSTIWLYAKQGKITPIKLSDRVTIFKKEDLDAFIERGM